MFLITFNLITLGWGWSSSKKNSEENQFIASTETWIISCQLHGIFLVDGIMYFLYIYIYIYIDTYDIIYISAFKKFIAYSPGLPKKTHHLHSFTPRSQLRPFRQERERLRSQFVQWASRWHDEAKPWWLESHGKIVEKPVTMRKTLFNDLV